MHYGLSTTRFLSILLTLSLLISSWGAAFAANDSTFTLGEPSSDYNVNLKISKNYATRKYILGPNDIISVQVPDYPEYNQNELRVQPDGKVVILPVGMVDVTGMSVEDLHTLLVSHFKHYLRNPQVAVRLEKTKPFIVYVSGAVVTPGSYELDTDVSKSQSVGGSSQDARIDRRTPLLSNVLVASGGVTYDADLEHVKIVNKLDRSELEVNVLDIALEGDANQDVYLMPGDSVIVPKVSQQTAANYQKFANASFSQRQIPVRVFGYVNSPGLIRLDTAQSNHLTAAIAAAGGYSQASPYAPKKVIVSRVNEQGKMVNQEINPSTDDLVLFPNDMIYVPDKARSIAGRAFDYLGRLIVPMAGIATGMNNWQLLFNPLRNWPSSISR